MVGGPLPPNSRILPALLHSMRAEFEFWYPFDLRVGPSCEVLATYIVNVFPYLNMVFTNVFTLLFRLCLRRNCP